VPHPAPRTAAVQPPAPRGPYRLAEPLNADEVALVRPYLVAHEQRQRRRTLVMAVYFGIDLDTHLIGAAR
jgi:hypothetical protein